jgi:hypothetical protein
MINMAAILVLLAARNTGRRIWIGVVVASAVLLNHNAMANPDVVDLGTASDFAVSGDTLFLLGIGMALLIAFRLFLLRKHPVSRSF